MAQDALTTLYDLPTVPKQTEQRYVTLRDEKLCLLDECNAIYGIIDSSAETLDTDEYTVLYGKTASGHKVRGFLLEDRYDEQLTVSGSWGYDQTPADINRALLITVSTWYKRAKLGDANDVVGGFSTLPREARDLMEARVRASI
jgi:hypothetical protein